MPRHSTRHEPPGGAFQSAVDWCLCDTLEGAAIRGLTSANFGGTAGSPGSARSATARSVGILAARFRLRRPWDTQALNAQSPRATQDQRRDF